MIMGETAQKWNDRKTGGGPGRVQGRCPSWGVEGGKAPHRKMDESIFKLKQILKPPEQKLHNCSTFGFF